MNKKTVKITIKKNGNSKAILISFDMKTEKFQSGDKSRFFTRLYGRKQIIKRGDKQYEYDREGILDEIPSMKVDNSVFIIMREHMKRMEEFMNNWKEKVMFKQFPVLLTKEELQKMRKKEVEL